VEKVAELCENWPASLNTPIARRSAMCRYFAIPVIASAFSLCDWAPIRAEADDVYTKARERMVERQIEARGVKDKLVLKALRKVPRHELVPERHRALSYSDQPLPIGEQQTISQPYIVAYMTERLKLKGGEKVLEVGTGSGYQAAVLAEICKEVYTIEIIKTLAERAEKDLKRLGYKNIFVKAGDGTVVGRIRRHSTRSSSPRPPTTSPSRSSSSWRLAGV